MIAAPIEAAIEQQREKVCDLEIAMMDARDAADRAEDALREAVRQHAAARVHLDHLRTFAEGGDEGPIA